MQKVLFFIGIFVLLFSPIIAAEGWGYNILESGTGLQPGINYSKVNVNHSSTSDNAILFNGYSVIGYKTWLETFFAPLPALANYLPLSGGIMSGDIDYDGNDALNIDDLNMTGVFRQSADGNMFVYDSDDEIHHVNVDLSRFDELRANTFTTPLDVATFSNATGDYINITAEDNGKISFIGVTAGSAISESFTPGSHILELTAGTNETPVLNRVYAYISSGEPTWGVSITEPEFQHAMVARVLLGDTESNPYAAALQEDGDNGFLKRVQRRFRKEGLLYESGFDYVATSNELSIGKGDYINGIYDQTSSYAHNITEGFYLLHTDGSYHWYNGFDELTEYSNGETIGNNKYFNIVWGITPYDGTGNIYAVIQGEPNVEYTSTTLAWADSSNTLQVYPVEEFLKIFFLPVARTIIKKGNGAQLLPNGAYAEDYRGGVAGGAASGGGLAEVDPVWTVEKVDYFRVDGTSPMQGNMDSTGYNITADYFLGNGSQLIGLPETYWTKILNVLTPGLGESVDINISRLIQSSVEMQGSATGWEMQLDGTSVIELDGTNALIKIGDIYEDYTGTYFEVDMDEGDFNFRNGKIVSQFTQNNPVTETATFSMTTNFTGIPAEDDNIVYGFRNVINDFREDDNGYGSSRTVYADYNLLNAISTNDDFEAGTLTYYGSYNKAKYVSGDKPDSSDVFIGGIYGEAEENTDLHDGDKSTHIYGVKGKSILNPQDDDSETLYGYGGYFEATGNGDCTQVSTGVYGTASGGATNYAGHFKGDVNVDGDNKDLFFGAGKDATIKYDGSNFVFNPKLIGSGLMKILGDLWVNEDLYVVGDTYLNDTFANFPSASMYIHEDNASTRSFNTQDVYENVTINQTVGELDGFSFSDGKITVIYSGKYQISNPISFSGQTGSTHGFTIGVNGVKQYECYTRRKLGSGDVDAVSVSCQIRLNVGDVVTSMSADEDATLNDILYQSSNLNIVRIGN